jgi:hypothetical protein
MTGTKEHPGFHLPVLDTKKNGSGEIPSHVSVIEIHVETVFHGYHMGGVRYRER